MNRPPLKTMVAGHPASVFLIGGLMAFSVYALTQNVETWPMAVVFGLTMNKVMEANKAITAYKNWQAAWNSMAPDDGPQRPRSRRWLLVLLLGLFAAYMAASLNGDAVRHAASVAGPVAFVLTLAALPVLCGIWLWRRRCRVHRPSSVVCVIARRTMPTPNLTDAYAALPAYCHALLRGQR